MARYGWSDHGAGNSWDRGWSGAGVGPYGYGYGDRTGWGGGYAGRYDRAYGAGARYDRDHGDRTRRVAPERSPTYGESGDPFARRWARREGYDAGRRVEPGRYAGPYRSYGARGGWVSSGRGYDRGYGHGRHRGGRGLW